jgi:predicted nucleic acid-binding protein
MALALLDTNVLVHAAFRDAEHHAAAATLVNQGLQSASKFCISPQNLIEFAAVASRVKFVDRALSSGELLQMCEVMYRSRRLAKIYPRRGTVVRALREGAAIAAAGPIWYDIFLATTMLDAGVRVIVTQNVADFQRIPFVTPQTIEQALSLSR